MKNVKERKMYSKISQKNRELKNDIIELIYFETRQSPALRAGNELGFKVFKLRKGGKRMQVAGVGGGDVALGFG